MYALAIFYGEVAGSFRWEQVIREHLSGPAVAEKALKLGCFRSIVDFDFWLREKHDVRGNLMYIIFFVVENKIVFLTHYMINKCVLSL